MSAAPVVGSRDRRGDPEGFGGDALAVFGVVRCNQKFTVKETFLLNKEQTLDHVRGANNPLLLFFGHGVAPLPFPRGCPRTGKGDGDPARGR